MSVRENLRNVIRKNRYVDSIFLMLLTNRLKGLPGIHRISAMMGAEGNKDLLSEGGLLTSEGQEATPNDLIIAIDAESEETFEKALSEIEEALSQKDMGKADDDYHPRRLESALSPQTNLMFCSLPGSYVRYEAKKALDNGLNCMIFSDNVSVEAELELKKCAQEKGLIVMGPDCGTAIIQGTALGFANRVNRGRIGIVGASGTGIQEVSVLIHHLGEGISNAIGTGGRDLSEAIGGISMLKGIEMLEQDPATELIVLISKPPAKSVEATILDRAQQCKKKVVVCFLAGDPNAATQRGLSCAGTLEEIAYLAVSTLRGKSVGPIPTPSGEEARGHWEKLTPKQRYLRGLFSGGTLADEALILLRDHLQIHSNLSKGIPLKDPRQSLEHTIVDLGDDLFTVGMPHPMIDYTTRMERLVMEAQDPDVAVLLLDIVIGDGSHLNPLEALVPALEKVFAQKNPPMVVTSITGTDEDPQGRTQIKETLEAMGALVLPSNAQAAKMAAMIACRTPILTREQSHV
jgi:succinyl-CoA synthetase alpha subunit